MVFGKKNYTEEELVRACVQNDRRAQEAFYRHFFPEMMRMCLRHTRDEDTALEIVNSGFLKVFKKIHTYAFQGKPGRLGAQAGVPLHGRSFPKQCTVLALPDPG